jgi:hypothetical protein
MVNNLLVIVAALLYLGTAGCGSQEGSENEQARQPTSSTGNADTGDNPGSGQQQDNAEPASESWEENLGDEDASELADAMQDVNDQMTMTELEGNQIPVNVYLSSTRTAENGDNYVILSFERTEYTEYDFSINLKTSGSADTDDVTSLEDWQNLDFAAGEQYREVEFMVSDDMEAEGFEVFLLDLESSEYVALSHKRVGFTIQDNDYETPTGTGAALQTSLDGSLYDEETGMQAHAPTWERTPEMDEALFGGQGGFTFDGTDDMMVIPNSDDINTAHKYSEKTVMVVFQTGHNLNGRQMIYEQGGTVRGINFYLDHGTLYMGAYNLANDDATTPWPYTALSQDLRPNTTYVAMLELDSGQGTLTGWLNGQSLGSLGGVGHLFHHPGRIGIGSVNNDTVYHDKKARSGNPFKGAFYGMTQYNRLLSDKEKSGLMQKTLATIGMHEKPFLRVDRVTAGAKEGVSAVIDVQVSLSYPLDKPLKIEPMFSGQATHGVDFFAKPAYEIPAFETSITFEMLLGDDDEFENAESLGVSFKDHSDVYQDQRAYVVDIKDDEGLDPGEGVAAWFDASQSSLRDLGDTGVHLDSKKGKNSPKVGASSAFYNSLMFNKGSSLLVLDNHQLINEAASYDQKTIAFAIQTGPQVSSRQVIYEQGGTVRGLNLYIDKGNLTFNAYNLARDQGHQPWGPASATLPVTANSVYFVIGVYDATYGFLELRVNRQVVTSSSVVGTLFRHPGRIGIGGVNSDIVFGDGKKARSGSRFSGEIAEMILLNRALSPTEASEFFDYWERKF